MKKILISILCFAYTLISFSQIILIDQIIFEPGDNISVVFNDMDISEGESGENVVWDFSANAGMDTITWRGIDPSDHELAQQLWPDSDLGSIIPAPNNDTIEFKTYEFYDFNNQSIATLGSYSILRNKITNEIDTQIVDYSTNPFEEFKFPLAYLDEFESDYNGLATTNFQGINSQIKRGGTVIMKADATGQIITPVGTFDNVLRVKRIESRYDTSSFEIMGQTIESVQETKNTIYDWLQPERKFTLFRVIYTTIKFPGLPPQEIPPVAFYTIENGVSNTYENSKLLDITFYPNPTSESLTIEDFDQLNVLKVEVLSSSGRLVKSIEEPSKTISMSRLVSGHYFIVLYTDVGKYTQKIMKL